MPTRIDWCDETINPLGHWCFGPGGTEENPKPCFYCYAKKLAARGMRGCEKCQRFEKHTHFEQLDKLAHWKRPRTIFVQSMGDLFHDEVPDEWIKEVFDACKNAPWHRYLFLTKNPYRYKCLYDQWTLPHGENYWYGMTVTQDSSPRMRSNYYNMFVSVEPIIREVEAVEKATLPKWMIVGSMTGPLAGKYPVKREWIENLAEDCKMRNIPIFMKESLRGLMNGELIQQFPW